MGKHFIEDKFKPLLFCNGKYHISRFGKVKSVYTISKCGIIRMTGTILATTVNSKGYEKVQISWMEKGVNIKKTMAVHRLVAMVWIPNPNNYPQINHKDLDKLNNDYRNLEWCTPLQNTVHAQKLGARPIAKPYIKKGRNPQYKKIINIETGETFGCLEDLCNQKGLDFKNTRRQINGERYCYIPYRYIREENIVKLPVCK